MNDVCSINEEYLNQSVPVFKTSTKKRQIELQILKELQPIEEEAFVREPKG